MKVPTAAFITRYSESLYPSHVNDAKIVPPCEVMNNDAGGNTIEAIHRKYHSNPAGRSKTRYEQENKVAAYQFASWVLGGHSEGGVGASTWLLKMEDEDRIEVRGIKGIFFLASYPVETLQGSLLVDFCSMAIAGGDDLILDKGQYEAAKKFSFQRWSWLSEQSFRVDKWSVCRG